MLLCCLPRCKDTNLKAIHNRQDTNDVHGDGCLPRCKDTNLKAIHNGQPFKHCRVRGCLPRCKDTNLKAIHNCAWRFQKQSLVVYHDVKIQI